jgi:hypothetical protein
MAPEALENIERITAPGLEAFRRDHLVPKRPVVITNLYDHQPIAQIRTEAAAVARLGEMPVEARHAYFPALLEKLQGRVTGKPFTIPLSGLLDSPQEWVCTECHLPPALRELVDIPAEALLRGPADVQLRMFLARRGERTLLHFDSDGRDTLLTQVFGRKRVTVIDVSQSQKLEPLVEDGANVSSRFVASYSDADKLDFLRYVKAWDTILHPGETIYIPMLAWHYIEYVDTSLSFNVRAGRNQYVTYLCDVLDPHVRPFQMCQVQALGRVYASEDALDPEQLAAFEKLRTLLIAGAAGGLEEARTFRRYLDEMHRRLCPRSFAVPYAPSDLGRSGTDADLHRWRPPAPTPAQAPKGGAGAVKVTPGVRFCRALEGPEPTLVVLRAGRCEAEIVVDEANESLLQLAQLIAAQEAGITPGQLAQGLDCEVDDVEAVLQVLAERDWVMPAGPASLEAPAGEPVAAA